MTEWTRRWHVMWWRGLQARGGGHTRLRACAEEDGGEEVSLGAPVPTADAPRGSGGAGEGPGEASEKGRRRCGRGSFLQLPSGGECSCARGVCVAPATLQCTPGCLVQRLLPAEITRGGRQRRSTRRKLSDRPASTNHHHHRNNNMSGNLLRDLTLPIDNLATRNVRRWAAEGNIAALEGTSVKDLNAADDVRMRRRRGLGRAGTGAAASVLRLGLGYSCTVGDSVGSGAGCLRPLWATQPSLDQPHLCFPFPNPACTEWGDLPPPCRAQRPGGHAGVACAPWRRHPRADQKGVCFLVSCSSLCSPDCPAHRIAHIQTLSRAGSRRCTLRPSTKGNSVQLR